MNACIVCSHIAEDNTQVSLKLEGGQAVVVNVCTTHAEECTIKDLRTAYLGRQAEIDKVIEQAKALGLAVSQSANGLTMVDQMVKPPASQQQPAKPITDLLPELEGEFVATNLIDQKTRMITSKGLTDARHGPVPAMSSYNLETVARQLPANARDGVAKMIVVEGRGGQPLQITGVRRDQTGTTITNVVKSHTDRDLQRRFKGMAQETIRNQGPDYRHGYADGRPAVVCPLCRGTLVIRNRGVETKCPKCDGQGFI